MNSALHSRNQLTSYRQRMECRLAEPGYRDVLYVSADGFWLTTWTGDHVARIFEWGKRHNRSTTRRHFRAVDEQRRVWCGVGEECMYAPVLLTNAQRQNT